MGDKLENPNDSCAELHLPTCTCTFLLFQRGLVERGRVSVGPVRLQLRIIFICRTFPSRQLLLVRDGRSFVLAEFLPRRTGDRVLFGGLFSALMCVCVQRTNRQNTSRGSTELIFCL